MSTQTIPISQIKDCAVTGVHFAQPTEVACYRESYFTWQPMELGGLFQESPVSGGYLYTRRHPPEYRELEYHTDMEIFYFVKGDVIMPFCTLRNGMPDMQTLQLIYIPENTQLVIEKNVGHFVPVAANCETASIVVVAPKMDAPRVPLPYPVRGS